MDMTEPITTGIHRNGQHFAKAFDVEGVGNTPEQAREDLRAKLFERASDMEDLAASIVLTEEAA